MDNNGIELREGFDSQFSARRFLLVLAGLIFVTYPGLILGTQAFCYRDAGLFSYPVAYFVRDSYLHGHWPLWNMLSDCGIPFLAQWNTLALYPPSLVYILLPMPWALNCFLLGHLLFSGLGAYYLALRWFGRRFAASVAGLAFAWNGLSIHCLMWPCHTAGLAWMPWVVHLCGRAVKENRRWCAWAALAGACQCLTGSPETILLTWLIVGVMAAADVFRGPQARARLLHRLPLVGILVVALGAVQLLPFLDLVKHGDRSAATGNGFWSLPPWGLANFLVPLFHSTSSLSGVFTQDEQQWTSSYYVGVWPVALAGIGLWRARWRRVTVLLALAIGGIFMAFGDQGFLLNALKTVAPFFGFIRFPVKFIILTVFSLSLLAAAGVAWLQEQPADSAWRALQKSAGVLAVAILAVLALGRWFPFPSDKWSDLWPNALGRLAFLAGIAVWFGQLIKYNSPRAKSWLATALLICLGLDICAHEPQQNPSVPAKAYAPISYELSPVPKPGESRAMLAPETERMLDHLVNPDLSRLYTRQRLQLFSDCNLLDGVPKLGGFMSVHPAEEQTVAELLKARKASEGVVEFLGVSQFAPLEPMFAWFKQTNSMPWATIGQQPVFLEAKPMLDALCSTNFAPRSVVYLPAERQPSVTAKADPGAKVLSSQFMPNACEFETTASARTMLVIAQTYFHHWQARMDGAPVPLLRANYAYQAVEVPAGRHRVRLEYIDRTFETGAVITIVALVACLMLVFFSRPSKRV